MARQLYKVFKIELFTYTVGTYSPGNELFTWAIIMQVFPTVPSPTATHLMCLSAAIPFSIVEILINSIVYSWSKLLFDSLLFRTNTVFAILISLIINNLLLKIDLYLFLVTFGLPWRLKCWLGWKDGAEEGWVYGIGGVTITYRSMEAERKTNLCSFLWSYWSRY